MKIFFMIMALLMFAATAVADDKTNCVDPTKHKYVKQATSLKPFTQEITLDCGSHVSNQSVNDKPERELKTPDHTALWASIVAAGAAILGGAVTAIFSYFVAKKNSDTQQSIEEKRLRANIVTTERLRWLQDIRQRLSLLYAQTDMQYSHLKRPVASGQQASSQIAFDKFSEEIMEQTNVITTLLNPNKPNQAKLIQSLQSKLAFLQQCFQQKSSGSTQFNDASYAAIKKGAFEALVDIGIETWKQIKNLE